MKETLPFKDFSNVAIWPVPGRPSKHGPGFHTQCCRQAAPIRYIITLFLKKWDIDMQSNPEVDHQAPGRLESIAFFAKSRLLIVRRWWSERGNPVPVHPVGRQWRGSPRIGEAKAALWTHLSADEFPLTAGKVQNLRAACRRLDGIEIPAGETFSFWRQLGRTTRSNGFTAGRELRSGCLVPNLGGGLCQLSGLLHAAALKAGLTVLERHEHSRMLPGTALNPDQDATVFWNYVDLRFSAPFSWRLETRLTSTDLVVSIRAVTGLGQNPAPSAQLPLGSPVRAAVDGDCHTCGVTSCFRHPSANRGHQPSAGHGAWLFDGMWPEFNDWCQRHARPGDHWLTPLDGHRWNKPSYAWDPPPGVSVHHTTLETLGRSWKQRRLPAQGAARQGFLLRSQQRLAELHARHLDPQARHLVVSQTLLPHLWRSGHLGGRTFDVLVNRWPMADLQARLDAAAELHPESDTLIDFRADPDLIDAETAALAAAARLITPHRAIAARFGSRALLLDWQMPEAAPDSTVPLNAEIPRWFFPASALGRKGIHELAAATRGLDEELLILGRASEGRGSPLEGVRHRPGNLSDFTTSTALVLPAWIEHEPRLALRALACGVPVIATRDCGLPPHPGLVEIDAGDVPALRTAMERCLHSSRQCAVA